MATATRDLVRNIRELAKQGLDARATGQVLELDGRAVFHMAKRHGIALPVTPEKPTREPKKKPAVRVPLALVADDRPFAIYERRRAACPRLNACEDAWLAQHGSEQAMCPAACPGAAPAEP